MRLLFTTATAADMARRSWDKRRAAALLPPEPTAPAPQLSTAAAIPEAEAGPNFRQRRLERVRAQLERLDDLISKARDPLDLDRLARAVGQLQVQEGILAGIPLPGSLRPSKMRAAPEPEIRPV